MLDFLHIIWYSNKCKKTIDKGVGRPALLILLGGCALAASNIVSKAKDLARPIANELSFSIWTVKFVKEGAEWYLRFFIDKEGGVTIDDCEAFSKAVEEPLDSADFIDRSYYLEVCSPGLNRELEEPEHFKEMMGRDIIVKTYKPFEGKKEFYGFLDGYDGERLVLSDGENTLTFDKTEIASAKLDDADF